MTCSVSRPRSRRRSSGTSAGARPRRSTTGIGSTRRRRATRRCSRDNAGNATVDLTGDGVADEFESDFAILHPIVSTTWQRNERWPITVAAEYFWNTQAHNDRDQGFAIGASVGRQQKKGDWRFDYQYQVIEQDAVFSVVAQDDFICQTNFEGHVASVWYTVTDDINLRLWTLICSRDHLGTTATTDSDQDQWRVRLDLNIRF